MTTALDLITTAYQSLGVYAPNENLDASDANLGFDRLRILIDSWRQEYLYLYRIVPIIIPLQNRISIYTISSISPVDQLLKPVPERITLGTGAALSTQGSGTAIVVYVTPAGTSTLQGVTAPSGVVEGSLVLNLTNPESLPFGSVISNLDTLSLSAPVLLPINPDDVLAFGLPPTPVEAVAGTEWRGIMSQSPALSFPDTVFFEKRYPLGVFHLTPMPNELPGYASGWVVVQGWYPFFNFQTLDTPNIVLTPGEFLAIDKNLAMDLKSYFADTPLPPTLMPMAIGAKEMLKRTNLVSRSMLRRSPAA